MGCTELLCCILNKPRLDNSTEIIARPRADCDGVMFEFDTWVEILLLVFFLKKDSSDYSQTRHPKQQ